MTPAPNVVLDTMLLVQAAASPNGSAAQFLREAENGIFQPITSWHQLLEFGRTMTKKWFADHGFGDEEISAFSEAYADLARVAPDRPVGPPLTKDPGDNFIVRLAQTTGSVLVTRDAGILANHPEMVPVLSPGDFAETLVQWQTHPPRYRLAADSNGALTLGF